MAHRISKSYKDEIQGVPAHQGCRPFRTPVASESLPMALPWAFTFRTFGAEDFAAPSGHTKYQIPNTKYQIPNSKFQIPSLTAKPRLGNRRHPASRKSMEGRYVIALFSTKGAR
ncbi:hypothetical protein [Luteolibacter yonseiensis]|uniref:hypothetical protein n=1 Tax=Luteolibacter yonseiensis TaxID=1144680 RepID=UPI0031EFE856